MSEYSPKSLNLFYTLIFYVTKHHSTQTHYAFNVSPASRVTTKLRPYFLLSKLQIYSAAVTLVVWPTSSDQRCLHRFLLLLSVSLFDKKVLVFEGVVCKLWLFKLYYSDLWPSSFGMWDLDAQMGWSPEIYYTHLFLWLSSSDLRRCDILLSVLLSNKKVLRSASSVEYTSSV